MILLVFAVLKQLAYLDSQVTRAYLQQARIEEAVDVGAQQ